MLPERELGWQPADDGLLQGNDATAQYSDDDFPADSEVRGSTELVACEGRNDVQQQGWVRYGLQKWSMWPGQSLLHG